MKKLLLTTALVGSLVAGNAIAQTTVTGNLNINFKSSDADVATGTTNNSGRGLGNEQQINIQNKGKLNNGMDYAAGFSMENDGGQSSTLFNENVYIDFISGNTTVTIGMDHIQNIDRTTSTLVGGMEAADLASGANGTGIFITAPGSDPAQSYHVGITQTVPGFGKFSALYAPSDDSTQGTGITDKNFVETDNESAWEVGFTGDFGVKGLNAHVFYNEKDRTSGSQAATATAVNDEKGHNYGVSYNFGQVTIGYDYKRNVAATVNADTSQNAYGVAYALTPTITLAANYTKADKDGTAADAKATTATVGYNLGPVSVLAYYSQLKNITGAADVDANVIYLAARTSF